MKTHSANAEASLASIVDSSDDAIISKDLEGNITSWNASAERLFGYTAEEAKGKHISLIIPAERLPEEEMILRQLKKKEKISHFETTRRNKSGRLVPVSLTISPIHNADGIMIGASKIARDLTERVEANFKIKEAIHKNDEFLNHISHELRTPMNAVVGIANLLLHSKTLSEKEKNLIDTLKHSADNLMNIINDLLDLARLEAYPEKLENIQFNLIGLAEEALDVMAVAAHDKGIALYSAYGQTVNGGYLGDPLRIKQLLMNLLSNAVKFTVKGFISVEMNSAVDPSSDVPMIIIKVTDTGIGIPKEMLPLIFDKFSQADSSMARHYGGVGLGLGLSKALVKKMDGSIKVESEVGLGSSFIVTLPLKKAPDETKFELISPRLPALPSETHKNILLVEDYAANVLVATLSLELLGYDFDVAPNGLEALRSFQHGTYDVILMDIQMPEMDGLEATRRIRRMEIDKHWPPTPIIGLSAHVGEQNKDQCYDVGMDDFVGKPFDAGELSQKIKHHMQLYREAG